MSRLKRLKQPHGERFELEARAVAALNHPNICQIYDIGPDYLVLEGSRTNVEAVGRGPLADWLFILVLAAFAVLRWRRYKRRMSTDPFQDMNRTPGAITCPRCEAP